MMRSAFSLLRSFKPKAPHTFALGLTLFSSLYLTNKRSIVSCNIKSPKDVIASNLKKPIKVRNNQKQKGQQVQLIAYQITQNLLVVVLVEDKDYNKHIGQEILKGKILSTTEGDQIQISKVIGKFDKFLFVQTKDSSKTQKINSLQKNSNLLYDEITIIDPTLQYPKIITAHITGTKSFSYILDTSSCHPGSLILHNNQFVGIISTVQPNGFSSFIPLSTLSNVSSRIANNKFDIHLGISVKNADENNGSFIVRIATSSPFAPYVKLGDVITRINGVEIRSSENIKDLINLKEQGTDVVVMRDGKEVKFSIDNL